MKTFLFFSLILLIADACSSPSVLSNCEDLKNALTLNDEARIKTQMLDFVHDLPTQDYTVQNLNTLVTNLTNQCKVTIGSVCFDCIKTNPPETEIKIALIVNNSIAANKAFDFSRDSNGKIQLVGIHD